MTAKPALYGKHADTGLLEIRAGVMFARDGWIIDPSRVVITVEVWSAMPFGPEQERSHCMEATITGGVTEQSYSDAYKLILGTYEQYWKMTGAEPPKNWRDQLAQSIGEAMGKFMNGPGKFPETLH